MPSGELLPYMATGLTRGLRALRQRPGRHLPVGDVVQARDQQGGVVGRGPTREQPRGHGVAQDLQIGRTGFTPEQTGELGHALVDLPLR